MGNGLLTIGVSALLSYRAALATTGENIANAENENYSRRNIVTEEVMGGQMTADSGHSGGQGVIVRDVTRAYDGFLAERLRDSQSTFASSEVFYTATQAVEDLMLPSAGGIDKGLNGFFDSLSTLSANPSDLALRQSTMEAGRALATGIADVAAGLIALRADVENQANTTAQMLTGRLSELAKLNEELNGASAANGGLNPIFDARDKLLGEISELVGTTIDIDASERPTVFLGETKGGPVLLRGISSAEVTLDMSEDLRLNIAREGETKESSQLVGGQLQGYRNALGVIDDALMQLNAVARRIANDVNTLHSQGLDLHGDFGTDFFKLQGWDAAPYDINRGSAFVEFTVTDYDKAAALGDFTLVRDQINGVWIAEDAAGDELARGAEVISVDGLTVTVTGTPANGDRLTISSVWGRAVDMRMALDSAEKLATAQATLVAADPQNTGSGGAVMGVLPVAPPPYDDLADILPVEGTAADGATLVQSGVVGYVPASAKSLNLAALGFQSTLDFAVTDAQAASASTLTFSLDGAAYSLDVSGVGASDASGLAAALNDGSVTTIDGETLADLGVHASGTSGAFSVARGNGDFDAAATLVTGAGVAAGTMTPARAGGGQIQVFTRNGVQLAGTAMDAVSAAALLTVENGFFDGATYIDEYLYPAGETGYRGMSSRQEAAGGAHTSTLSLDTAQVWNTPDLPPLSTAKTIDLAYVTGEDKSFALAEGMSARLAAQTINDEVEGLNVSAVTAREMTVAGDGMVSFQMTGTNIADLTISANIVGGRLDVLAANLNAASYTTGVSASLSPEGDRIVLTHESGEDIVIKGFTHSGGGTASFASVGADGIATAAPNVTLGAGSDSTRLGGELKFEAPDVFSVGLNGAMSASTIDPATGGIFEQSFDKAGAVQTFTFTEDAAFDGSAASVDGLTAFAASQTFDLTVNGESVSYTGVDSAAGLASELRQAAAQSSTLGGALASLPVAGTSTSVRLGKDTYVLRMDSSGDVIVSGPEEGRITASFNASNRLELTVTDGTLDGQAVFVPAGTPNAMAFGLAGGQSPVSTVSGLDMDAGGLPSTMEVEVAGTRYTVGVSLGGASLQVGFPGTSQMVGGRLQFEFASDVGPVRIPQSAGAKAAGFATADASAQVVDGALTLTSTSGAPVSANMTSSSTVQGRVMLDDLPDEDLIIVMTGSDPLRIAGSYANGPEGPTNENVEVEVIDPEAGQVRLVDRDTGDTIALRTLDDSRSAVFGALQFALTGSPDAGDKFSMIANDGFAGDGRNVNAMADLRFADPTTGKGGFGQILAALQAEKGAIVAAAKNRHDVASVTLDSAERVYSDRTDVNLDTEAARLIEYQQAYQASAQILKVAGELFDTLINTL